ncbi:MAG TPA: DUF6644 family protein, partial [Steroidobacteraceae bacterium]|nr:DUF6644 family protein [Steroidobacteraceae bacterium]
FTAMRESALVYPIVLSTHLTCIAIFGGLILMSDLRLLGLALTQVPVSEVLLRTRTFKRIGFVIMVTCGILLGGSKLFNYYDNPYFRVKMTLLALVGVHAIVFHRRVYGDPSKLDGLKIMPGVAKAAGLVSMVLWVGILSMGRWIAYFERPDTHPH